MERLKAFWLYLRGEIVTPRPIVQPAKDGDTWSRRVDLSGLAETKRLEWLAASACFERKLYSAAADYAIAASGNGVARIHEEMK